MAEMLEHMSEYLYDFTKFIFASIRCTIPNFQTCKQFCCSLYGAHTVIKFGTTTVEETFNIANINYYNVILWTPFLRCLGVILDFNGPGHIRMGTALVPRNHPSESSDGEPNAMAVAIRGLHKPPE